MANGKKCAHSACTCAATADSDYCSAYCENVEDTGTTTISCDCRHPGCGGEITT